MEFIPTRDLVTLKEYRTRLKTYVRSILEHCDETKGQWFLINSEMGSGKTHIVARELNRAGLRVVWFSSMHKNLEEIKPIIGDEDEVCHVYGLQHFLKKNFDACPHAAVILEQATKGISGSSLCKKCTKNMQWTCEYQRTIKTAPEKRVVLAPLNYIHLEEFLTPWSRRRDIIIFDEDPTKQFFKKDVMTLSRIKQLRACFDRLRTSDVDTIRNFSWGMYLDLGDMITLFENVRDSRQADRQIDPFNPLALLQNYFGHDQDDGLDSQCTELRERLYGTTRIEFPEFDAWWLFEKSIQPNLHGLEGLFYQLWKAAKTGADVGINTEERYFYYYTPPKLSTTSTYLTLDFTGNADRLELVLNRAKELASTPDYPTDVSAWGRDKLGIDWVTSSGSRILQVGKASNAKSNLAMRKNRVRRVLMAIHSRHPRNNVAVISYKGWAKRQELQSLQEIFGKRLSYEHFFNLRGLNNLQDKSVFVIIGTPLMNFHQFCQIARDYYADPLIPDVSAVTIASLGKNLSHELQIVREVFTTCEMVQAIGRSRYVNKKRWVYVLSNEDLQEYIPEIEGIAERELIKQSGTPMTAVQEDLLKSARKLLNNRGWLTIESLAIEAGRSYEVTRRDMHYVIKTFNLVEDHQREAEGGRPKRIYVKS